MNQTPYNYGNIENTGNTNCFISFINNVLGDIVYCQTAEKCVQVTENF